MEEEYETEFEAWYKVPRIDARGSLHIEETDARVVADFGGGVLTLDICDHDLTAILHEVAPALRFGASIVAQVKGELTRFDGVRAICSSGQKGEPKLKLTRLDCLRWQYITTQNGLQPSGAQGLLGYWLHLGVKNAAA